MNYYNEHDPKAAAWLRELIKAGHIAAGDVDERSIEDVKPSELHGYTQCHFFAGIGGWPLALRRAGWPDDRPVWTGSCPCQPFSTAGKGEGFADERHLWPAFRWLIGQCLPSVVFGEQVASKTTDPWIDLVHADLEALGYAFGCVPFPSAGVGAPHIRDRAYWVGESQNPDRWSRERREETGTRQDELGRRGYLCGGETGRVGIPHSTGPQPGRQGSEAAGYGSAVDATGGDGGVEHPESDGREQRRAESDGWSASTRCCTGGMADTDSGKCGGFTEFRGAECNGQDAGWSQGGGKLGACGDNGTARPINGFWRDADWLFCRDGKWRPVEPGTFPLAHGAAARVGRLRAYGNAIVAPVAAEFVRAYREIR